MRAGGSAGIEGECWRDGGGGSAGIEGECWRDGGEHWPQRCSTPMPALSKITPEAADSATRPTDTVHCHSPTCGEPKAARTARRSSRAAPRRLASIRTSTDAWRAGSEEQSARPSGDRRAAPGTRRSRKRGAGTADLANGHGPPMKGKRCRAGPHDSTRPAWRGGAVDVGAAAVAATSRHHRRPPKRRRRRSGVSRVGQYLLRHVGRPSVCRGKVRPQLANARSPRRERTDDELPGLPK